MKIIDINCAIGVPMKSHRFTEAEGLVRWMDSYRIDSAVVYHSEALREPEMGNQLMVDISAASGGRLKSCMVLNPSLANLGLPGKGSPLCRLRALKPSAVRAFPDDQKYPFSVFYASDILEVCQQLHMPLLVKQKYDDLFLTLLPEISQTYPDVPIILLRMGFNRSRQYFPILKKLPNVYFDMSVMLDAASIEEITDRFGSERLLFGSGLPRFEPGGALGLLLYANISEADRENIAHANFERLERGIRYDD